MSVSSDTESESGGSVSGWDPATFMETSTQIGCMGEPPFTNGSHLRSTLETLRELDICAVENDERSLEQIWSASGTVLRFLDRVIEFSPSSEGTRAEVEETLRLLLDLSFLTILFEYRVVIHDTVARNTDVQVMSAIVCWVDVILAKLGQAVISAAGSLCGVVSSQEHHPRTILAQRDDDMLRAATQLPECWSDVAGVLRAEHHSPAAVRLASSLLFGVYVMVPQLAGDTPPFDEGDTLLQAFDARIRRIVTNPNWDTHLNVEGTNEQERISFAMFVSLYAVAESGEPSSLDLSCRPQSCAVLGDMMEAILQLDPSQSPRSIISPPATIDTASVILTRWGTTIPWTWSTWIDGRLHNSEVIEHLAVVWLHNMVLPSYGCLWLNADNSGDRDLIVALTSRPMPALSMMARLLLCTLRVMKDTESKLWTLAMRDVIVKLCWSMKFLLRLVEVDGPSIGVIQSMLCELFALLPDEEAELAAKDSILEAISFFPAYLKVAAAVFSESKTKCTRKFDERLLALGRLLLGSAVSHCTLRAVRQTAQFLSLIWMAGTPNYFNSDAIYRLLSALCSAIGSYPQVWNVTGDAAVGLFSVVEARRDDPTFQPLERWCEHKILWELASSADPTDLLLAASLAAYVRATVQHLHNCNHLLWADIWSYFRDVLLFILARGLTVVGSEEPVGLFVAPAICSALLSLVEHANEHTLRYCLSCPWTACLMTKLKMLGDSCGGEAGEYAAILRQRIRPVAELLDSHLEPGSGFPKATYSPVTESAFCFIRSVPCLVFSAS